MRSSTPPRNLSTVPAIAQGRSTPERRSRHLVGVRTGASRSLSLGVALTVAAVTIVVVACFGSQTALAQQASAVARHGSGIKGSSNGVVSPHAVTVSLKWDRLLGPNSQIFESSPNQARLDDDGTSIVVGSRGNGDVYAVHLSNGSTVAGWPKHTDAGVDSSPAVYAPSGGLDDVYVTSGNVPGKNPPIYNENCGTHIAAVHRHHLRVRSFGKPAVGPRPA